MTATPFPALEPLLPSPVREALSTLERRAMVRAPTGLSFVIADQPGLVNPASWDELAGPHSFLLSRRYLEALVRARVPNLSHRFVLAFDGTRPVVALALQILDVGADRFRPATATGLIDGLDTAQLEQRVRQRVLVCGNLLSGGLDGVAFAEGLDPALGWRAVAEALYRVRRAEKLNGQTNLVVVKDFTSAQLESSRPLEDVSYRVMAGGPTMVLTLEPTWRTHDDYLASMTSKHRSAIKRQVYAPLAEAGVRVERLSFERVDGLKHRLLALHLEVQDHAAVRPITVSADYWPAMAQLDDVCTFHGLLRGEELLGFLLVQAMGDEVHAAQIGFSRQAARCLPLYLRLLHTAVEEGLSRRARRVVLGRTALEPKARLGARPVDTFLWVRHRVPVVNSLAGRLVDLVRHEPEPHIDPFKRGAAASLPKEDAP